MINKEILHDIGLSKAEVTTYLALLEIGQSTSGPIIEKSKLQSSVVHRALKTLTERGLISYITIGKNKHYQATSPKVLISYIENKKKLLKDILPELESKQDKRREINGVEMFVGKRAIFSLLLNLIVDAKKGEEYLSFSLIEPHEDEEVVEFYQIYSEAPYGKTIGHLKII